MDPALFLVTSGANRVGQAAIAVTHTVGALPDYGSLPPETNSAKMYCGPGSAPMLAAATAWGNLADDVHSAAVSYRRVISELTGDSWRGPASTVMADAGTTHVAWLTDTAARATEAADKARQAASFYETALATMVPPPVIAANRAHAVLLGRQNLYGQHAHAIASTEADYQVMWAQDAAAMYDYADQSAVAARLTPFLSPLHTADPGAAGLLSAAPAALRRLARPTPTTAPATVGRAGSVGSLSVPPAWPPTRTNQSQWAVSRGFVPKPVRHNATDMLPAWT